MPAKETLWERDPHTEGKHLVLRHYLNAWLPIMGRWNGRIVFVDGFAGPGEYRGGEDGSPAVALKALAQHGHKGFIKAEVVFIFIEKDQLRAAHLDSVVQRFQVDLPKNAKVQVVHGTFDGSMTGVLNGLDEQRKKMAPAFVMIDPFGVSDTPMSVIEHILRNPRCEVYVSFMYENMNRFLGSAEFEPHLDLLFGTRRWRKALALSGEKRRSFLYNLYAAQLRSAGARYVVHFDLYEGNRLVYAIFFGTQHAKGCDVMKKAIWKVAPFGDFTFRGSKDDQLLLGVDHPNLDPLAAALCQEFGKKGWVSIDSVENFVSLDQVEYHTGHLRKALKLMERADCIEIKDGTRKKKATYPPGAKLRFKCAHESRSVIMAEPS